ncbi:LytTR family transcriptional regulator DNA-binding domain-containing protein [Luxibacter massiliensis]|uniref:LytTR family transcriptional regulator DNA-binding domain-containing protein n=1 Tax=Luxibacter massiliensis TaxID=2219695 RepID=UPI001F22CE32|nr:LytTR family transcriptional regulator DNA-binding domain-containing protein [Luxibacter massiliensis]DAJ00456.1 MAG TPA: response regulator [Caudoviricetes sp.]
MTTEERDYIYILDEDKIWLKVMLHDIYYIETIKSSHYCEVVTREGRGRLHADITPLQKELPWYFFKTRASTLANLKLVGKVDTAKRILYFDDLVSCTYTERVAKELKRILRLKSYRRYGGMTDEDHTDASL